MTRKLSQSIWTTNCRKADLILLADSPKTGIWSEPTGGLLDRVKERLKGVRVMSASSASEAGLQGSLRAAAFLGAHEIVVVRLWNGDRHEDFELRTEVWKRGVRVTLCEAPAEVDAVVSAYHTAVLAQLAPTDDTAIGPSSVWAA